MAETDLLVIVPHEDDELAIAGSMFYMVLIFIVLYVAGVAIYGGFKAFQKWREQIRDRKFRSEEQGRSQK